jgi:hypothetical protein
MPIHYTVRDKLLFDYPLIILLIDDFSMSSFMYVVRIEPFIYSTLSQEA